ncbi:MAG: adenylate/guanylate cyclase domain-containing protein [Desulfotignum sp.]|nr:adenylate/guanylate cyclase domain-containing protein [Desulfotignum sp.]MCF8125867.1 adenylate/guanylate cyclase domain-containing protein [Desulfotignum sp.]
MKPKLNRLKWLKGYWQIGLIGTCITLVFCLLYVFKPVFFEFMEYKLYDVFVQQTVKPPETVSVAVIDIDEYSLARFGQWPWPRYRVALLLKKLQMAGVLAVGMDILFAEHDRTSPLVLKKNLQQDLNVTMGFTGLPEQLMDNDQVLANILSDGAYCLGYSFSFEETRDKAFGTDLIPYFKTSVVREPGAPSPVSLLPPGRNMVPPLPVLMHKAGHAGFMNTLTDRDGVLRKVPLMMGFEGKIYPHLSLATLMTALQKNIPDPVLKITSGGIDSIRIGHTVVPLMANGAMLINYKGPGRTFPYVSAAHVLEDKADTALLENKVVFLGASATGLMDIRVSPLDEVYPGVEVNATIVNNILNQDFIRRSDWIPGLELVGILAWGLITTFAIGWSNARFALPVTLVLGILAWYGGILCLDSYQIWISPFFPLMVLAVNFAVLNLVKFWLSDRKKRFYRAAFSKYVSKAVVDQISEYPDKMTLDGEEKEISIMFTDIREFTTLSEKLTPTQVTQLLHDYFTPVTQSIIRNKGTLDKFIGDAVMCFWNAPLDVQGHQLFAVKTGFEMLDALNRLNQQFKDKYGIQIDIGIGIHSGRCRVGNMGSADLFDYTIIGDNVNLTSRLESLTKFYGTKMIVSHTLIPHLPDSMPVQELDRVRVKGKTEPVVIYTVYQPSEKQRQSLQNELSIHEKALSYYQNRLFDKAFDQFSQLGDLCPDRKIYAIYQERCKIFMANPPARDWDGVFVHKTK